jgi:gliding motility-associated-like protein
MALPLPAKVKPSFRLNKNLSYHIVMRKICFSVASLLLFFVGVNAQNGSDCSQPLPFCTGTTYNFPANYDPSDPGAGNGPEAQPGPNYGCLLGRPNPVWYYMQVQNSGNIQISLTGAQSGTTPSNDIDYICYGPFNNLSNVCTGQLTAANTVDCSYLSFAGAPTEIIDIPNAQSGQYYLILLTNYSNTACNIIFSQTGGAGTTDCGVLSNATNDGPACEGMPVTFTGDVQNATSPTVQWFKLPDYTTPISVATTFTIPSAMPSDAGTYAFVVLDNATFEYDTSYTTLVVNPIPAAPEFTFTSPACQGSTITFTPTSIISGANYHWVSSNNYSSNQNVVTFLNAETYLNGDYTLTVTIAGCTSPPTTHPLVVTPTVLPVVSGPTTVCEGLQVELQVTNAAVFESFSWNGAAGYSTHSVSAGSYVLAATDSNGCTRSAAPYVVTLVPNPLSITGSPAVCEGSEITLVATPGKQSYLWSNGSLNDSITVTQGGQVTVTVVSTNGCIKSDTIMVEVFDKPNIQFSPNKICGDELVTFQNNTTLSDNYGSVQNAWGWHFGHLNPDSTQAVSTTEEPTHLFPAPGTYNVTLVVGTNNGCSDTATFAFTVVEKPKPNFTFESLCFGSGQFFNISQQGNLPFKTVAWNFGDGETSSSTDSVIFHTYPAIETYTVSLTITDTMGCVQDTTIDISLKDTPLLDDIPNIITPNGDGTNDDFTFLPIFEDCYNYTFTVFNRWGGKVFETEKSDKGFAGISGLGSKLKDGVYFWVFIANGLGAGQGEKIMKNGSITVVGTK